MTSKAYFPKLPGFQVEQILCTDAQVTLTARSLSASAACPLCGQLTPRIHSRYTRYLGDLPWAGKAVRLVLHMHRFFCDNHACPRHTFRERAFPLATAHARRTTYLTGILRVLGMALGGEAGARVVDRLSMQVSPDTLLRLIRQDTAPDIKLVSVNPLVAPRVLGVDDWALRKGRTYGTILVDLELHCPIDLLPERSAASLAAWLQAHPGVEIITRDRCGLYAEGAAQGAPQAIQVADRWHLLQNLREALERVIEHHSACLQAVSVVVPSRGKGEEHRRQAGRSQRHKRYDQVIALYNQGMTERAIASATKLSRHTVRRYIYAGRFPEIARRNPPRSMLKDYKPYLEQQWAIGCENAMQLWRELQAQGYPGSYKLVRVWANRQRQLGAVCSADPNHGTGNITNKTTRGKALLGVMRPPSARQVVWLFLRQPQKLSPQEQTQLSLICQGNEEVAMAYQLGQEFLKMLRERQPEALLPWLEKVQMKEAGALQGLAQSLRRDFAAVKAAMTFEWSNGQVEGQVNRLKLIKRQMYGRANFDLLRLRVLAR